MSKMLYLSLFCPLKFCWTLGKIHEILKGRIDLCNVRSLISHNIFIDLQNRKETYTSHGENFAMV